MGLFYSSRAHTGLKKMSPARGGSLWGKNGDEGVDRCKPNFNTIWETHGAVTCKRNCVDIFCRLSRMHERDGQTDHRTVSWSTIRECRLNEWEAVVCVNIISPYMWFHLVRPTTFIVYMAQHTITYYYITNKRYGQTLTQLNSMARPLGIATPQLIHTRAGAAQLCATKHRSSSDMKISRKLS